jgi:hypothetical protein
MTSISDAPPLKVEFGGPDRIVVVEKALVKPGKCIVCGASSDGRPFVDFNLYIEWYGAVYFCAFCFVNACNKLGYYNPDQFDDVTDKYNATLKRVARLESDNDSIRNILGNMFNLDPNQRDELVLLWDEFTSWRAGEKSPEPDNRKSTEVDKRTDEQSSSKRPNDISSSASGVRDNDAFI